MLKLPRYKPRTADSLKVCCRIHAFLLKKGTLLALRARLVVALRMKTQLFNKASVFISGVFFFLSGLLAQAQHTLSGTLQDCSRCKIQIATYEGHENTVLNAVRATSDGSFVLPLPYLNYQGFYRLEIESLQGQQLLSFPVWLADSDVKLDGAPSQGYASFFFDDVYNASFARTSKAIISIQDRLEYLEEGEGLFDGHPFDKKRQKAYAKELKTLEQTYQKAIATAPSEPLKAAFRFRKKLDVFLHPYPEAFSPAIFNRIDWEQPQVFHEPLVPDIITGVFREYLFQRDLATNQEQGAFIEAFTLALWAAVPQELPIGKSAQQLMRNGYRQLEAWDALALLDSLQGREDAAKNFVPVADAINWLAKDSNGEPVSSNQFLGKRILLVFWSPLCGYCNALLSQYEADRDKLLAKGIEVIGITMDSGYLPKNKLNAFHHLLLDEEYLNTGDIPKGITVSSNFSFASTPAYFLIDEEGFLAARYFTWDEVLQELK